MTTEIEEGVLRKIKRALTSGLNKETIRLKSRKEQDKIHDHLPRPGKKLTPDEKKGLERSHQLGKRASAVSGGNFFMRNWPKTPKELNYMGSKKLEESDLNTREALAQKMRQRLDENLKPSQKAVKHLLDKEVKKNSGASGDDFQPTKRSIALVKKTKLEEGGIKDLVTKDEEEKRLLKTDKPQKVLSDVERKKLGKLKKKSERLDELSSSKYAALADDRTEKFNRLSSWNPKRARVAKVADDATQMYHVRRAEERDKEKAAKKQVDEDSLNEVSKGLAIKTYGKMAVARKADPSKYTRSTLGPKIARKWGLKTKFQADDHAAAALGAKKHPLDRLDAHKQKSSKSSGSLDEASPGLLIRYMQKANKKNNELGLKENFLSKKHLHILQQLRLRLLQTR
jgi:hypothetical protein